MPHDALTSAYDSTFLSHDLPDERERLRTLEAAADPYTFAIIDRLALPDDAHCLEIGAGAGSVARYLASRCTRGRVIATDIDVRFLDGLPTNVEVLAHDASREPLPTGPFDLIHTRAVLCHIPARDDVLTRAVERLAPGGILLAEEPSSHSLDSSANAAFRTALLAIERLLGETLGTDVRWARGLPRELLELGLTDVTLNAAQLAVGDHGAGDAFTHALLTQAAPTLRAAGLVSEHDLQAALDFISDPNCHDLSYTLISVWGRAAVADVSPSS
jgi:SAM-dependent methyltransferase